MRQLFVSATTTVSPLRPSLQRKPSTRAPPFPEFPTQGGGEGGKAGKPVGAAATDGADGLARGGEESRGMAQREVLSSLTSLGVMTKSRSISRMAPSFLYFPQ